MQDVIGHNPYGSIFETCEPERSCGPHVIDFFKMTTIIRICNVPDALHRRLKSRAALAGMSLSDYLPSAIRKMAERPTLGELRARLERWSAVTPSVAPAQAVRAERDRR